MLVLHRPIEPTAPKVTNSALLQQAGPGIAGTALRDSYPAALMSRSLWSLRHSLFPAGCCVARRLEVAEGNELVRCQGPPCQGPDPDRVFFPARSATESSGTPFDTAKHRRKHVGEANVGA